MNLRDYMRRCEEFAAAEKEARFRAARAEYWRKIQARINQDADDVVVANVAAAAVLQYTLHTSPY